MIVCLDVGNTNIFGGIFDEENLLLRFRYTTSPGNTSDQLGTFLKNVLRENKLDTEAVTQIVICSVVPSIDYSLRAACIKYFDIDPFFLQHGVKTGLKINYYNPSELGADRLANAIAAIKHYPKQNIIIIDFGTATTFCAISKTKEYLGGTILAGMRLSMDALQTHTAKLFAVEIVKPTGIVGRSTTENIQAGLYYGHLGALREIIQRTTAECFPDEPPIVIGTGGFSHLFESEGIFTTLIPDLILQGLRQVLLLNNEL